MGLPQGHTAGWNNSHSTGQTVSQNNFIVPEIGVECTVEIGRGRAVLGDVGGGQWDGKEKEGAEGVLWETVRWECRRKCSLGDKKGSDGVSLSRPREFHQIRRTPRGGRPGTRHRRWHGNLLKCILGGKQKRCTVASLYSGRCAAFVHSIQL